MNLFFVVIVVNIYNVLIQLRFIKLSMLMRYSLCLVNQVFITTSQLIMLSGWINNATNQNSRILSK